MAIKKVPTGFEVRFRVAGRGSREYKKVFPTKAESERFQRYTIAQFETQADVKPWLEKPKDMCRLSELVVLWDETHDQFLRALKRTSIKLPKGQAAHVLWHTLASHFIMNGGNILTLQKVLGHSDIKMTMRYAHLAPDFLEEATRLNPLSDRVEF